MSTQILVPAILALQSGEAGGLGSRIVSSLPRDPASIFALLLIVVCAAAVLWYGRPRGGGQRTDESARPL